MMDLPIKSRTKHFKKMLKRQVENKLITMMLIGIRELSFGFILFTIVTSQTSFQPRGNAVLFLILLYIIENLLRGITNKVYLIYPIAIGIDLFVRREMIDFSYLIKNSLGSMERIGLFVSATLAVIGILILLSTVIAYLAIKIYLSSVFKIIKDKEIHGRIKKEYPEFLEMELPRVEELLVKIKQERELTAKEIILFNTTLTINKLIEEEELEEAGIHKLKDLYIFLEIE